MTQQLRAYICGWCRRHTVVAVDAPKPERCRVCRKPLRDLTPAERAQRDTRRS